MSGPDSHVPKVVILGDLMKRIIGAFRTFGTIFAIVNDVSVVINLFEEFTKCAKLYILLFQFPMTLMIN